MNDNSQALLSTRTANIAIVDDHPLLRQTYRKVLLHLGHNVTIEAANGRLFIDMLANSPLPDLCLLDNNMPVMNGIDTARSLKKHFPAIKIVVSTMNTEPRTIKEFHELQVEGFVNKNAPFEDFKAALEKALDWQ